MIGFVRSYAERVKRGERRARVLVAVLGALGLAMTLAGGRAYTNGPVNPLFRPAAETDRLARVVIVQRRAAHVAMYVQPLPRVRAPRMPFDPPAIAPAPVGCAPSPPPRVRGPPVVAIRV